MKTINKEFLKKFESYDNHIRPNPEEPLEVTITLLVQSWNPIITFTKNTDFLINLCLKVWTFKLWLFQLQSISRLNQVDMRYEMGVFLRQEWLDERLSFSQGFYSFRPLSGYVFEHQGICVWKFIKLHHGDPIENFQVSARCAASSPKIRVKSPIKAPEHILRWSHYIRFNHCSKIMDSWFGFLRNNQWKASHSYQK